MKYEEAKRHANEIFLMINKCYDIHEECGSTLLLEIADDLKKQLRYFYDIMRKHRLLDKSSQELDKIGKSIKR